MQFLTKEEMHSSEQIFTPRVLDEAGRIKTEDGLQKMRAQRSSHSGISQESWPRDEHVARILSVPECAE